MDSVHRRWIALIIALVIAVPVGYAVADEGGEAEVQPASGCPAAAAALAEIGVEIDNFIGGCPSEATIAEDIARQRLLEEQADTLMDDLRSSREAGTLDPEGQSYLEELEENGGPDWLTHANEPNGEGGD